MYNLPYFKAENPAEVLAFMHRHPFVVITGSDAQARPLATHVPVLVEERKGQVVLQGHIMKQSDHHKAFNHNPHVLAIFSGAHSYISASWYVNQEQASTWNYQAVHGKGVLRFLGDDELLELLHRLTLKFENNPSSPSLVEHLSPHYVKHLMKAIVAFEIELYAVDHVFKLSQNRDDESYRNIVQRLDLGDYQARELAEVMRKKSKIKF